MKVFISWSGSLSQKSAQLLSSWLPNVVQSIEPFLSSEDIAKGTKWFEEINRNISEAAVGIICLTADNLDKPWIFFEAGALSMALGKPHVCPLLVNIRESDVKGPLAQFQCTLNTHDDMLKLIKTVNTQLDKSGLAEAVLVRSFDKWWAEYEKEMAKIIESESQSQPKPIKRDHYEMLAEILETCRAIQRNVRPRLTMAELSTLGGPGTGIQIPAPVARAMRESVKKGFGLTGLSADEAGKE